ncbi:hypothetical protein FGRMN_9174 [Fusarium graminum]|nr:hypothetical protein FGRMN_9174 [Fusarium graminum]
MKTSIFLTILSATASFVSAGIVVTPVFFNQIVEKLSGDCPFGVVTPQGCAYSSARLKARLRGRVGIQTTVFGFGVGKTQIEELLDSMSVLGW